MSRALQKSRGAAVSYEQVTPVGIVFLQDIGCCEMVEVKIDYGKVPNTLPAFFSAEVTPPPKNINLRIQRDYFSYSKGDSFCGG